MHPDTRSVADHMQEFGLRVLGRAIYDSMFAEMGRPFAHALAVVHAAHGAEILVKARIAQEHPLLIFDSLPSQGSGSELLTISELLSKGKTAEYSKLPELLWATTGHRMEHRDRFIDFGRLRNTIVHFAVPALEHSRETLRFCIEVMEPMLDKFWGESAIPYAEEWDEVIVSEGYLQEQLKHHGIQVPECAKTRLTEH